MPILQDVSGGSQVLAERVQYYLDPQVQTNTPTNATPVGVGRTSIVEINPTF
jgi:hypothetical protein